MMSSDRVLGLVVAGFGGVLLVWLVPNFVTSQPGDPLDPSLFPRAAGWLITLLGLLLFILADNNGSVPPRREVLVFGSFVAALLMAAFWLPKVGFLPVACSLMVASLLLLRERRPLWALLTLFAVPAFVWCLFEVLLRRSLS